MMDAIFGWFMLSILAVIFIGAIRPIVKFILLAGAAALIYALFAASGMDLFGAIK